MKNFVTITLITICFSLDLRSQTPILLTDQTIKLSSLGEEYFYLGFHEGDLVQLDFEELRNKGLKEIEVKDYYTGRSIYSNYESKRIEKKQISIPATGIYQFRFYNASLGKRIGKISISRIPSEGNEKFNSTVYWKTVYDTTRISQNEKYLKSIDTSIVNLTKKVVKVNSKTNQNGNRQYIHFTLPKNTVKWSYYIGVGQEGQMALEQATKTLARNAKPLLNDPSGYGPLAALALNGASYITQLQRGEDVEYYLVNAENLNLLRNQQSFHSINKGKIINDFSSYSRNSNEVLYFYFINDNAITGVTVNVDITAIVVTKKWGSRTIQVPQISKRRVAYLRS